MSESWVDTIEFAVAVLIQLSILAIAISSLLNRQWLTAYSGIVVFMLTFAPPIMERRFNVRLPVEISFFTCVFLFASYVLGETRDFYERVWWSGAEGGDVVMIESFDVSRLLILP